MPLGLESGTVILREDHTAWAREFAGEKARILEAIGDHVAGIRHVGSTAVPGVPAKPILDILVGVSNHEQATVCIAPLEALGYTYRHEYGIPRRHYFVKGEPRTHHLHLVELGSRHWVMTLAFRDLLARDAEAARGYGSAKQALARRFASDRPSYQREKDRVIERMLGGAGEGA